MTREEREAEKREWDEAVTKLFEALAVLTGMGNGLIEVTKTPARSSVFLLSITEDVSTMMMMNDDG
jgi:hypothetical protein